MNTIRRRSPDFLALLFSASSIVHLVRPQTFESLIPTWLPNPRVVVYLSGVAEIVCSIGLLRRTRWAGAASAALLVAVFPGNVQMAINASHESRGGVTPNLALCMLRLPLQLLLIWAALQASRSSRLELGGTKREESARV